MYAFIGEIRAEVTDERTDVPCFMASLSVQDLLSVGGASGREGLRRTEPRWEKLERPRRAEIEASRLASGRLDGHSELSIFTLLTKDAEIVGGALVHGVASSCASMTSSMLASPQGASEQYM
jgi:hypothetical protein